MKPCAIICIFWLILCISATAQTDRSGPVVETKLHSKLTLAGSNCVAQVAVYYFPEDILTENAISPEDLEHTYWSKTVINNFQKARLRKEFVLSLAPSSFTRRSTSRTDVRWGCVLYDKNGKRIISIYLDKFGAGQVDDIQVSTDRKLLELLRKNFCFH